MLNLRKRACRKWCAPLVKTLQTKGGPIMNAAITSAFIALLPGSSGARLWCAAMTITMPTMSWSKSVEKAQNIDRGALRRSPISSGWVSIISPNQRRKISGVRLIFDIPLVGGISGS